MMTWNLKREPPEAWRRRVRQVARFLRQHAPDLLCLQEATPHQLADVRALLGHMRWVDGVPDARGERNAIAYDPARHALVDSGGFWLAREPGSTPRTATWASLVDRQHAARLTVVNVHLDHESAESRLLAAEQLLDRFPNAVLAGDFNAEPHTPPHDVLTKVHTDPLPASGAETMAGDGDKPADARYDWILLPHGVRAREARVLQDAPSDHHAVAVELEPRRADAPRD